MRARVKPDPRLELAAAIEAGLLQDPAVSAVAGEGIETRGRGPAVRGIGVNLEEGRLQVGVSLRLGHVSRESLPLIADRVRGLCYRTWDHHGIEGLPVVDLHIVDFDD